MQVQLRDAELEEQLRLARAEAARLGAELAKLQRASVQALMDTGAKATRSVQRASVSTRSPAERSALHAARNVRQGASGWMLLARGPVGIDSCCNWRRHTVLPAGVPRAPRGYAEAVRTHAGVDCVKICQKSGARKPRKLRADGTNADRFALVGPGERSGVAWHGMAWPVGRSVGR